MGKNIVVSGKQKNYEEITFLKGFSILTIVIMHLIRYYMENSPAIISKVASLGGTGVHIFFLCSGIGLYLSYLKHSTSYFEFIRKKFLKIYLPYVIVVFISAVVPVVYEENVVKALFSHIFLYKMFLPQYEESFGDHFWYMSTLFQFYLLFIPLCLLLKKMHAKIFLWICVTISVMWWIIIGIMGLGDIRVFGSFFLQYLWEFAFGMVIAEYLANGKNIKLSQIWLIILGVVGLFLGGVAGLKGNAFKLFNDIPLMFGYGSVVLFIWSLNIKWVKKVIAFLSSISYEWYLTHILVFACFYRLIYFWEADNGLVTTFIFGAVAFGLSIIIAYLYHKLWERKKLKGNDL